MKEITTSQIKVIHVIKSAMGMDEDSYRAMLHEFANVNSSKSLTWRQARELISDMQRKAGNYPPGNAALKTRHDDLASRAGMATPPQLRKIEAIWSEVSRAENAESRVNALRTFLVRFAKVSDLRFLARDGAAKVINALEAMKKRK